MKVQKGKEFWMSVNNISKVTKLINEKRKVDKNIYTSNIQTFIVLDFNLTKEQNLMLLKNVLKNTKLFELFGYIINDMYKFDFINTSSVDASIQSNNYNTNDLDLLEGINLLEHSFGVVNQMNSKIDKSYGQVFDFYLLAALVHDFGKNPQLRNNYFLSSEKGHHKASAEYLEQKRDELSESFGKFELDMINLVIEAVRVHHDNLNISIKIPNNLSSIVDKIDNNELQNIILKFLKESDISQREIELKKINSLK